PEAPACERAEEVREPPRQARAEREGDRPHRMTLSRTDATLLAVSVQGTGLDARPGKARPSFVRRRQVDALATRELAAWRRPRRADSRGRARRLPRCGPRARRGGTRSRAEARREHPR